LGSNTVGVKYGGGQIRLGSNIGVFVFMLYGVVFLNFTEEVFVFQFIIIFALVARHVDTVNRLFRLAGKVV